MEYKHKATFLADFRVNPKITKPANIALGAVGDLAKQFPEHILGKGTDDLMLLSSNLFVANLANLNGAAVGSKVALSLAKTMPYKFLDVNHDRKKIVGSIVSAFYSSYSDKYLDGEGSDPLTEEEVTDLSTPWNVGYTAVFYKLIYSGLTKLIEDCSNPDNLDKFNTLSSSWEVAYNQYILGIGSPRLDQCEKITDPNQIAELEPYLLINKGPGKYKGAPIFSIITDMDALVMGAGIVEAPAAAVSGLLAKTTEDLVFKGDEGKITPEIATEEKNIPTETNLSVIKNEPKSPEIAANVIEIDNKNAVGEEKNQYLAKNTVIITRQPMKITSLKDLTDETLKTVTANSIADFLASEISRESDKFVKEKNTQAEALKEAETKYSTLKASYDSLEKNLTEVKANLEKVQAAQKEAEATELFNSRMAKFDGTYELDADLRKVIASRIQNLDAEAFAGVEKDFAVLLKDKNREVLAKSKKNEIVASTQEVIDGVVANATKTQDPAPANTSTPNETLIDKARKAFSLANVTITK